MTPNYTTTSKGNIMGLGPVKFNENFKVNENIKRPIDFEEVMSNLNYSKLGKLGQIFRHGIVEMKDGVWRWNPNDAIEWLEINNKSDFNRLWIALVEGKVALTDHMKLYMQIGYTLSGFMEVYEQHKANEIQGLKGVVGGESMLDYIIRIFTKRYRYLLV